MPSQDLISCENLDGDYRDVLYQAIRNVLATDIALTTYAQIIDGVPVSSVASDQYSNRYIPGHPIKSHVALCPGAQEEAEKMRVGFDPGSLRFSSTLLQAYRSTTPSTRDFNLRLIELTAVALHQIAIFVFRLGRRLHDPSTTQGKDIEGVTLWEREPDEWARLIPWPTMFTHPNFVAMEQYPNGVADMVGYWTENRILGGVAIFDRSRDWNDDAPEPNVFFQCSRRNVTYRICQLLDEQQKMLTDFLLANDGIAITRCPLPVLPGAENRVRIDPVDAIPVHRVYRDVWEREQLREPLRTGRLYDRDVVSSLDYPELDVDEEIKRLDAIIEEADKRNKRQ